MEKKSKKVTFHPSQITRHKYLILILVACKLNLMFQNSMGIIRPTMILSLAKSKKSSRPVEHEKDPQNAYPS